MQIFIGSSKESLRQVRTICTWIEDEGHKPLPWYKTGLFPAGEYLFEQLKQVAKGVDAAIFIFNEDDKVWYRDDVVKQPRDNVLIEFGLFAASLGKGRTIFCRNGRPKPASDLLGITYVDISESREHKARDELSSWLHRLAKPDPLGPVNRILERLKNPFQASGKLTLFQKGTELIKSARNRIALVAKTPIPIVGTRPYNGSGAPYSYEVEQYDEYVRLIQESSKGRGVQFQCVGSIPAMIDDLRDADTQGFKKRVKRNIQGLTSLARIPDSQFHLRWLGTTSMMTFLVADNAFMIWFKDARKENVWITAENEEIAGALFHNAETLPEKFSRSELLRRLGL